MDFIDINSLYCYMDKLQAITGAITAMFITVLSVSLTLEMWSHVAAILGLISTIAFALLAWRKNLLKSGFSHFQDLYKTEMTDFKIEVRRYISQADQNNKVTLEKMADLYVKTHNEIMEQNRLCGLIQSKKPYEAKEEKEWKDNIENKLRILNEKISHIEDCVNNKK